MSALDQAFIKAFAKEQPAATTVRSAPPRVTPREALNALAAEAPRFDELYDAGTFYRLDVGQEERAVPAMHLAPDRKVPRRLQRRSAARNEFDIELPLQPEPMAVEPPVSVPPRRNWSRSMLEIARQMAHFDLLQKNDSEAPPEITALDPPEASKPTVAPEVPSQPVAAQPEVQLPPSAPPTIANLWTVHEPIVTQSLVELADAHSWVAQPLAPSVTCHENVTEWAKSATPIATPASPEKSVVESDAADRKKRKYRIEGSHPRIPRPHRLPEVKPVLDQPVKAEQPLAELAPPILPVTTPDEIDSESQPVQLPKAPAGEAAVLSEAVGIQPAIEKPVEEAVPALAQESAPTPNAGAAPASEPVTILSTTVPKRPYIPLWEVDRFTWPPLCDKLMHDPNGYFASASNKLLSVVRGGLKVLGVTGSRRGEGRTTLALCLARAAAQAGIHVALVDADFARPQLATTLGLETAYGWQEAATGKIPLSEAAVKSIADRVTVLPLEVSTTESPLSLADPRVTATLRATAATFELVIVDLGPLPSSNEALFPAGENCPLDAAVVVRDTRYASVNESRLVGDRLYDAGIEAVGIAENFVTQPELAFL